MVGPYASVGNGTRTFFSRNATREPGWFKVFPKSGSAGLPAVCFEGHTCSDFSAVRLFPFGRSGVGVFRGISSTAAFVLLLCLGASSVAMASQPNKAAPISSGANQQPSAAVPAPPSASEKEIKGYTLPPEKYAKAVAYSQAQYRLYFAAFAYDVILLLFLLRLGIGPLFRDCAERVSSRRFVQAALFTLLLLLTLGVLELPIKIYGHLLSLKFGISVQSWGSWTWDRIKTAILIFVLGSPLVWIFYGLIRRSARRWWLYCWLISLPILLLLVFIAPVVIDPMFETFEPLARTQPTLVALLEKEAARAGLNIPPERMLLMKASLKTKALNAYVTGFGASKRIVVWDTTLDKMTVPETLSVFGHEMGHYVLGHIWHIVLFAAVSLFVSFLLVFRCVGGMLARWGAGWRIRGVDDWASLLALLLLLLIFTFFASPLANTYSRHVEHVADVYGLELIHGFVPHANEVAAGAFQILGEVDLSDPHPSEFIKVWLYDHPPLDERVHFALTYDPWADGKSPRYVK